jgi:hypothetical protein
MRRIDFVHLGARFSIPPLRSRSTRRRAMEREMIEEDGVLVELGQASLITEGGMGDVIEPMGLWHKAGLSSE